MDTSFLESRLIGIPWSHVIHGSELTFALLVIHGISN